MTCARVELLPVLGDALAEVGDDLDPQPDDLALPVDREVDVVHLPPSVGGGGEALPPVLDPLHRPIEEDGGTGGQRLLGVDVELAAEAATHLRHDDAHLLLGPAP